MGRVSRVPYHQNIYDLFDVVRSERLTDPVAQVAEWERQTGRAFPAAMAECYSTAVTVRLNAGEPTEWTLTLPQLWSEYSNDESARPIPEVFRYFEPPPVEPDTADASPEFRTHLGEPRQLGDVCSG